MSELKFIDTEAGPIRDGILEDLELSLIHI